MIIIILCNYYYYYSLKLLLLIELLLLLFFTILLLFFAIIYFAIIIFFFLPPFFFLPACSPAFLSTVVELNMQLGKISSQVSFFYFPFPPSNILLTEILSKERKKGKMDKGSLNQVCLGRKKKQFFPCSLLSCPSFSFSFFFFSFFLVSPTNPNPIQQLHQPQPGGEADRVLMGLVGLVGW